jgi:hypothetical protein
MISLNTLLFPDTDICKDRLYPLLLFFSPMHFLQPIETDPERDKQADCDIFMEQGLCQGHTPVPLEKNRQRFVHLIRDIRERKDDYGAQLASLTMAAMSTPPSARRGESKNEIISSLLSSHSLATSSSDEEIELWQARLVLAIAEILERDEHELQQNLNMLDSQELEMFRSLQGDDRDEDHPFAELQRIKARLETRRPQAEKNRFKAWLQLMKRFQWQEDLFWLATSQDSADQIFNLFEKKTGGMAIPVLSLPLPAHINISTAYLVKQIKDFQQDTRHIHLEIKNGLENLARIVDYDPGSDEMLLPGTTDWVEKWNMILEDHFPASNHGRSAVTIYILPDHPIADLLSLNLLKPDGAGFKHGLLGVLKN